MTEPSRLTSRKLAELIADALLWGKIIKQDDLERTVGIIEEEIDARKAVKDY